MLVSRLKKNLFRSLVSSIIKVTKIRVPKGSYQNDIRILVSWWGGAIQRFASQKTLGIVGCIAWHCIAPVMQSGPSKQGTSRYIDTQLTILSRILGFIHCRNPYQGVGFRGLTETNKTFFIILNVAFGG